MSDKPPFLSVCVITYQRPVMLAQCLGKIAHGRQSLDAARYEILVSDDDPLGSARGVVESYAGVRWLKGPNRGVAANRNCVARAARGEWIVYVDDDELPEPDWLSHMDEAASSGRWDVIEGRVEPVNCPDSVLWYAPVVPWGGIFCTANLAIRKSVLFALGAFDERLAVSHEDMDLGRRIIASSLKTTFIPAALVLHPARKRTLAQVVKNEIQQQTQTHKLGCSEGNDASSAIIRWLWIPASVLRNAIRILRIQYASINRSSWRRGLASAFMTLSCIPAVMITILWSGSSRE